MSIFAVLRTHGAAWNDSLALQAQLGWDAHAAFMNGLQRDGFIVIGGPLEGSPDVLLIVRAGTPDEIMERLRGDPWTHDDLLRVIRISPWTIRLGSLPR